MIYREKWAVAIRLRFLVASTFLLLVGGCSAYTEWRNREFADIAERFFSVAASGSREGLSPVLADTAIYDNIIVLREEAPDLFRAAAQDLRPIAADRGDSLALVAFETTSEPKETIIIRFVKRGGGWLVKNVQLTDRM